MSHAGILSNSYETRKRIVDIVLFFAYLAVFLYALMHREYYYSETNGAFRPIKLFLIAAVFVIGLVPLLFRRFLEKRLQARARRLCVALTVLTPLISFGFTVLITNSIPKNYSPANYSDGARLRPESAVYNLLIVAVMLMILLLVTNHMLISSMICILSGVIFCIANYFVFLFRGIPILASDFSSLNTAMTVADEFSYTPNYTTLLAIQGVFLFFFCFRCLGPTRLFTGRERLRFAKKTAIAAVLFLLFANTDYLAWRKVKMSMFKPLVSYNRNGTFLTLLRSWQLVRVKAPKGYSAELVQEIADRYPSDAAADAKDLPNIIVIIDEAFSDLGVVADLKPSEDYMPFIHSLQKDFTHGYTYASVLGSGTANTEFEVLTGNSILMLPHNCIAFQVYMKRAMSSMTSVAASLGYQGLYALHPYIGANYNRPVAYKNLGFETYLSIDDMPEDAPRLRNYISDLAVNDMIISRYEQAKAQSDAPFLFYTMTMQNHSGYDTDYDNFEVNIKLPEYDNPGAERYLSLVKHSDEALEELVHYFEKVKEPTVILFLGDHQPNMKTAFLNLLTNNAYEMWTEEETMSRYAVPFILWSNYDLPVKEYEATSMNYLWTILSETCGLPLTGYQKYLKDLSEEIPVITANGYWSSDGTFYLTDDAASPCYNKLIEYECLIYNNMMDASHRPENFYSLR